VDDNYSLTVWIVKAGQEEEFVARWSDFAAWSAAEGLRARAQLLRDVDEPTRFISFGPWETLDAIRRWRTLSGFQEQLARLSEVVERFEPHTLELVARR
jgi:heme-degrading monooxygenase HmoA